MIDPVKFTNYDLTDKQLQEYALFCVAVAGKNAATTARILDEFLTYIKKKTGGRDHFACLRKIAVVESLPPLLKSFGFGCYQMKAKGFIELANSSLNLRECTVDDLEQITGIGFKTSRFFVLHTRRNAQVSCLDVHILRWMKRRGFKNIPPQTPSSRKHYMEIEKKYLDLCKKLKRNPAELDLWIWNQERGSFAA